MENMPDMWVDAIKANDKFRQVLHTGKTTQVAAIRLADREKAMFGGIDDEHFLVVAGKVLDGSNVHPTGTLISLHAGTVRELAADGGPVQLLRIGGIEAPEGSSAPDRQTASAQTLERITAREFNVEARKKAAKDGASLPDGSFPIYNGHDLQNASMLLHHADNVPEAKAHIKKRAKDLGLPVPYDARDTDSDGM